MSDTTTGHAGGAGVTDDLRGSLERVQYNQKYDILSDYQDFINLAVAYAAEHPADAGEPISVAWLQAIGFTGPNQIASMRCGPITLDPYANDESDQWWETEFCGTKFRTRGQVRVLCRALGVDIKEQK